MHVLKLFQSVRATFNNDSDILYCTCTFHYVLTNGYIICNLTDNRLIEESFQNEMQEKESSDGEESKIRKRRTKSKEAGQTKYHLQLCAYGSSIN